jgi:hypothetical protein
MAKLMMMAGGIVEPGASRHGMVIAHVVLSARGSPTRIFKVLGPVSGPLVTELPGATTIDLGRFQTELGDDLEPELASARALGATVGVATPSSAWVCGIVGEHLKRTEGIDVGT